jgi:hypothetical protein
MNSTPGGVAFLFLAILLFNAVAHDTAYADTNLLFAADSNGNKLADSLDQVLADLERQGRGQDAIRVVAILAVPPTRAVLEPVPMLGGRLGHRYSSVFSGFSGIIPADQIPVLVSELGSKLLLLELDTPLEFLMDTSVPQTRARPLVWDHASGYGFRGSPATTIGFIDTGLDDSHPDLAGKLVFWHDFSSEAIAHPIDVAGHGTAVAGVALGTGAVLGSGPVAEIPLTSTGVASHAGLSFPLLLPGGDASSLSASLFWSEAGITGCLDFSPVDQPWTGQGCSSLVPLLEEWACADAGWYRVWVGFPAHPGNHLYSLPMTVPYAVSLDGFNHFSGMAPGCPAAVAKVGTATVGDPTWNSNYVAACDTFHAANQQLNLKVVNASLRASGTATTLATNALVEAGSVFCVAAGNSPGNPLSDIASAELAITVGAVDDFGQLTDYSSYGEEDSGKPDVVAPGGNWSNNRYDLGRAIYVVDSNDGDAHGYSASFPDQFPDDYQRSGRGTSYATPHVAGLAALIIQALESTGPSWGYTQDEALLVKTIILMTATETNLPRAAGAGMDPPLDRGGKDVYEGYGMINADAAVEAVLNVWPGPTTSTQAIPFGEGPADRRCWATRLATEGQQLGISLAVPPGLDADLYIYMAGLQANGDPLLLASSTNPGTGQDESVVFTPTPGLDCYLVVKRISGEGEALLDLAVAGTMADTPRVAELLGAYPNPFNPRTSIKFNLSGTQDVKLAVHDLAGRLVKTLASGQFEAGNHTVVWHGQDNQGLAMASGTYFVMLQTDEARRSLKVQLVR